MSENRTVASLEIFGSKGENDHIEVTGFAVKTDPALKIVSSLAGFIGSMAKGAAGLPEGLAAVLPVLLPEVAKVFEGLRSGSLAEDDMKPIDMTFILDLLDELGLKVVKPDGSELTKEEIDEYDNAMLDDDFDDDGEDTKIYPPKVNSSSLTDEESTLAAASVDEMKPFETEEENVKGEPPIDAEHDKAVSDAMDAYAAGDDLPQPSLTPEQLAALDIRTPTADA